MGCRLLLGNRVYGYTGVRVYGCNFSINPTNFQNGNAFIWRSDSKRGQVAGGGGQGPGEND